MKKYRGFTLIELLVVIAIIGILASIVLVSLGGARDRARDARIQAAMTQIRSTAELLYNSDAYDYSGLCEGATDPDPDTLNGAHASYGSELTALENDINGNNNDAGVACFAGTDDYCSSSVLATGAAICVSSSGQVGANACIAADTACTP